MDVDTTGLVAGESSTTGIHQLSVRFERADGFDTVISLVPKRATVTWISSEGSVDVFTFTGPVAVSAKGVDGGHSRKSNRTIICDGSDMVTVTVDWSPGD